ncbi:MAG: PASTA domain-containing protein [Actinomycetota bacterium]|nr:PASTA domain-containing protein [Actinomycetota bacterium]
MKRQSHWMLRPDGSRQVFYGKINKDKMKLALKKLFIILACIAAGGVAGYLAYQGVLFVREVTVPDVMALTTVQAGARLKDAGLKLKVQGQDFDPSIPSGGIIRQDPEAGGKLEPGRHVKVVLSKGPEASRMPSVVGKTLNEATSILTASGMSATKIIKSHSDTVPEGIVIAQDPGPDEKPSIPIGLVVSEGPYKVTYYAPDFRMLTEDNARQIANTVGVQPVFSNSGDFVVDQNPKPGTTLTGGQKVFLTLGGK